MEQNNGKFRLRLNLFDGIVLLVALALGAFLAWSALKPDTSTAQTTPQSHTLQYTLRFQRWPEGTSGLIEAGDLQVDTVKNYELGRVVSFETVPAQTLLLSQTDKKYVLSTVQGYEDILVTVESPCTISQEGDLILYDWEDSGTGDNLGAPNHVGMVAGVTGNTIRVIEGNKGEAVARRTLAVNGRYIRGYCLPDYASKAKEGSGMDQEQFDAMMDDYKSRHALPVPDSTPAAWEKEGVDWAVENGIMAGDGHGDLMLHAPLTRAQFTVMLKRYHDAVNGL